MSDDTTISEIQLRGIGAMAAELAEARALVDRLETLVKSMLVYYGCEYDYEDGEPCLGRDLPGGEEPCLQCACEAVLRGDPFGEITQVVIEGHLVKADRKLVPPLEAGESQQ